jgi:hypothetical protein
MKTSDHTLSGETKEPPPTGTAGANGVDAASTAPFDGIGKLVEPPPLREEALHADPQPEFGARRRARGAIEPPKAKRPSRVPVLASGLAVCISLVALTGPVTKPWLEKRVSIPPEYAFLLGDSGVAAVGARVDETDRRLAAVAGRVDGIEAVGGNVNVAALRIERLERTESSSDARLNDLAARLDAVAARLDPREARINAATSLEQVRERGMAVQSTLDAMTSSQDQRFALVEAAVAASQTELAAARTELATLTSQLAEAAQAGQAAAAAAFDELRRADAARLKTTRMALAIQQLGAKLQTSRPFEREMDIIRRLSAGNPDFAETVAVLGQSAGTGVATLSELRESYNALVSPRILIAVAATTQRTLGDRVGSWLESVAEAAGAESLRTASVEQQTLEAVARRLAESDLKVAVELLSRMGPPASVVARRWLMEANARLAIDDAAAALLSLTLDPMVEG